MFNLFTKISAEKARNISPVTLAFIGDAVFTLYVREREVLTCERKLNDLQKVTADTVSATNQSKLLSEIEGAFTQEESDIYHRARNAKKSTKSKNASVADYNRSTGFEAVLGYLYLIGDYDRISALLESKNEN